MVSYIFCKKCNKVVDEFEDKCGWCEEAKQFVFPSPMVCTHVYPDGTEEKVRYGQYESIMITKENGWPVYRTKTLAVPTYSVSEVLRKDGIKVIFETPFYAISEKYFGDDSKREANRKSLSGNG